jgi:serine-protein kinase ATM
MEFGDLPVRLKSSQITERSKAVGDLKHLLKSSSFITTGRKEWMLIVDALLQAIQAERVFYMKTSQKNTAATRLSSCAQALRSVIRACVSRLRIRNVNSLLDHFVNNLLNEDGSLFEPLAVEYTKALRYVLEYQPHVEHLRETWDTVMSFCITALSALQEDANEDSQSGNWSSGRSTFRRHHGTVNNSGRSAYTGFAADELIACIRQLCRTTNVSLQDRALAALAVLTKHIQLATSFKSSLLDALAAVNLMVAKIVNTHLEWTRQVILDLIPTFSTLWLFKETALHDYVLAFLIITHHHLNVILRKEPNIHIRSDLEHFLEITQDEYTTRLSRYQLRLDDLRLSPYILQNDLCLPHIGAFTLRDGAGTSESQWMTIYSIAWIASILDKTRDDVQDDEVNENEPRKRRRITTNLESFIHRSVSTEGTSQVSVLQILAFTAALSPLSKENSTQVIQSLMGLMSHANSLVASWAMLTLANCALQQSANDISGQMWLRIWELGSRGIPSPSIARAASLLLDVLLQRKMVDYSSVSQSLHNMLQFSELTGPGVLADSTVSFWLTSARVILQESAGRMRSLHEKLLRWMFRKWTPSEIFNQFQAFNADDITQVLLMTEYMLQAPLLTSTGLSY